MNENIKSTIEVVNEEPISFDVGDLVHYVEPDWQEVVLITSKPNKLGNFKGILLYVENDLALYIGTVCTGNVKDFIKFKGKLTLEQ